MTDASILAIGEKHSTAGRFAREFGEEQFLAASRELLAEERERIARWLEMQHGTRDQREHAEKLAGMLRRESRGA